MVYMFDIFVQLWRYSAWDDWERATKFLSFPNSSLILHLVTKMENTNSQLCSNGHWTVGFTHSMAKEAKESELPKISPRLQVTWRDKSSFNSTNSNTWRYLLILDSVQIITKAIWKVKSELCINILLRKWKPYCLLTNNWELIFPS